MARKLTLDPDTPATWPAEIIEAALLAATKEQMSLALRRRGAAATKLVRTNPKPCPHGCGESFSGRAYRAHLPVCPSRS